MNEALKVLSLEFSKLYSRMGRPPERLLQALLLQAFYSQIEEA